MGPSFLPHSPHASLTKTSNAHREAWSGHADPHRCPWTQRVQNPLQSQLLSPTLHLQGFPLLSLPLFSFLALSQNPRPG